MSRSWSPKPGDRVSRHPRDAEIKPFRLKLPTSRGRPTLPTPVIPIALISVLISVGTIALMLPFASDREGLAPFLEALLTATSAVTVTGVTINDPTEYWTIFGKITIMLLMVFGGILYMTLATLMFALIGHRSHVTERFFAPDVRQLDTLEGFKSLAAKIFMVSASIQLVGFVLFAARFLLIYPPGDAVWYATFQSISGFNGVGLSIIPDRVELTPFHFDPFLIAITGILILAGSTGYLVIFDLFHSRRLSLCTLNTKLVLLTTLIFTFAGTFIFFLAEHSNPNTIGTISTMGQMLVSLFESLNSRTAGFFTIGFHHTADQTKILLALLMFVGGTSASVSGGVKVNTVAIIFASVVSTIRNHSYPTAFGREIPPVQLQRALTVSVSALIAILTFSLILSLTEGNMPFASLLFESVSAISLVGSPTGLASDMSPFGHVILTAEMILGRIGPLTLVFAMSTHDRPPTYVFAQERVTIG